MFVALFVSGLLFIAIWTNEARLERDEIQTFDNEYGVMMGINQRLLWNYLTNITDENAKQIEYFEPILNEWKEFWHEWAKQAYEQQCYDNVGKACKMISEIRDSSRVCEKSIAVKLKTIESKISRIYSSLTVRLHDTSYTGEEEVNKLMAKLVDANDLKLVWQQWHDEGSKIKPLFEEKFLLLDRASQLSGFNNLWRLWIGDLRMTEPLKTAQTLWNEVQHFYKLLFGFVRYRLSQSYGTSVINQSMPIPVYLLKSLWGDQWGNVQEIVLPYGAEQTVKKRTDQDKNDRGILELAQHIYEEIGWEKLPPNFWSNSVFFKNESSKMDCHPLAFDFLNGNDFRVKMCLNELNQQDSNHSLSKLIHELGHIYYFKSYVSQPRLFRAGANSAFHEALGDTMTLVWLNCFNDKRHHREERVNLLMRQALRSFTLLPWALSLEQWRHDLFTGEISFEEANQYWRAIRYKMQGVVPPDFWNTEGRLDPVSKYHVANFMPYLRYFFAQFLSHQFYEALCQEDENDVKRFNRSRFQQLR